MKLTVNVSTSYDIVIEKGISDKIGKLITEVCNCCKVLIITDSNVPKEYSQKIYDNLQKIGYMPFIYTIPSGESSKSITNFALIHNYLAENLFSRKDLIVAVGGGVVGDLSAFVASTYMRGIKFVNVPTTMLSCIDSSVGGKTGVNLECGKNLVGTFYQPSLVVVDPLFLNSLPKDIYNDGLGEAIKYGIMDSSVWEVLKNDANNNIEEFIYKCLSIKKYVVEQDEKEGGLRQVLNLGHTFGHAIETLSNYTILHGIAVVKGIVIIAKYALKNGEISQEKYNEIVSVISKYDIDYTCPYSLEDLKLIMQKDKKANGGFVNLICIKDIGKVYIKNIKIDEIQL